MSPENIERRKNDQARWDKIAGFMARIDQRNIDKDLNYAVQEDLIIDHDKRITVLEHKATRIETVALGIPAVGSLAWVVFKLGQAFHLK